MKKLLTILLSCLTFILNVQAQQRTCGTTQNTAAALLADPSMQTRIDAIEARLASVNTNPDPQAKLKNTRVDVITIPVVVHVVYNTTQQNVTDARIQTQLDVLNKDFRLRNSDSLPANHAFWPFSNDAHIEFCLAHTDPNGFYTSGITRTATSITSFDNNSATPWDFVKFTTYGGKDAWDPSKYLNIWVCNLDGGVLGFATPPGGNPAYDGVVIDFTNFGTGSGTAAPYNRGRTATHEIGHYLNLSHIWGDATCGNDFVSDTKQAYEANYSCPTFPHNANSCFGTGADGEMYMNYMDYVNDNCMNMFTTGQINRMRASLAADRPGLINSTKCLFPTAINNLDVSNAVAIYPNPSTGTFTIESQSYNLTNSNITITNTMGAIVQQIKNVNSFPYILNLNSLANGLYYLKMSNGKHTVSRKLEIRN